jgi:AhpD family alkylhydroperoxidase
MSRIQRLPIEEWDPELRNAVHLDAMLPFQRNGVEISAHAPHMAKAMGAFFAISKAGQTLPPRLLELVRLRIAFHNQCRSCMAMRYQSGIDDGVTEELVCSLEKPMEAPDLTDAEKAALAYADLFANNHFAIDDAVYDNLRKYFPESQIVELGMNVASFVGFGRLAATFDMVEELPEAFQDKSAKAAPWTHAGVPVS